MKYLSKRKAAIRSHRDVFPESFVQSLEKLHLKIKRGKVLCAWKIPGQLNQFHRRKFTADAQIQGGKVARNFPFFITF